VSEAVKKEGVEKKRAKGKKSHNATRRTCELIKEPAESQEGEKTFTLRWIIEESPTGRCEIAIKEGDGTLRETAESNFQCRGLKTEPQG